MSRSRTTSQTASLRGHVAASLDLPAALSPHIAEIFTGLDSLGSSPRRITGLLSRGGLRPGARVLDLACGKGALAVALAARLGCRVTGIDAYEPFLQSARDLAVRRGVDRLCKFRQGDVRRAPKGRFDAAVMLGLFPVTRSAPFLRRLVRPGGFYLVDDAFRDERFRPMPTDLASVPTRREILARIAALGDEVIATDIPTPSQGDRLNRTLIRRLAVRATLLARDRPALRKPLQDFLARRRTANTLLRGPLRPAVWLIRRAD